MTWVLDLDGVVWLSGREIPGAADAVNRLRESGQQVVFFTNNSGPALAAHVAALRNVGIHATEADVLTSSQAAASLVAPGTRAAVVGDIGVAEALVARGVEVVPAESGPGAVVVGRTTELSFRGLAAAADAIRDGAQFIATNTDATLPTPDGIEPGAGAVVAFLQVASGVEPVVAGKPHEAAARLVAALVGAIDVMVGDRPETDGLFANLLGAKFALVLSGITAAADLPVRPVPDFVAGDLGRIVSQVLEGDPPGAGAGR